MTRPDTEILQAVSRCIRWHIPFALIQKPGCDDWIFFASYSETDDNGEDGLEVSFFGEGADSAAFIPATLSARDILDLRADFIPLPEADIFARRESTRFMHYYAALHELIGFHKHEGGKTVFSRLIAVRSSTDPLEVALDYFSRFPDTFRALYFTRATGLWLVATPELLLSSSVPDRFSTMSLAGTRWGCPVTEPWDTKNIEEHEYVTSHIVSSLASLGLEVRVHNPSTIEFGAVQHLCEKIDAMGQADFSTILSTVSPTPAVCGTPVGEAMSRIMDLETHSRHCYGGWLMLREGNRQSAYVNLRCALVTPDSKKGNLYNIFAGGGITASSDALTEWNEAGNKARQLVDAIVDKNRIDTSGEQERITYQSIDQAFSLGS